MGLEFTEIETAAGLARFYANLQDIDKRAKFVLHNLTRGARGQLQKEDRLSLSIPAGRRYVFYRGPPAQSAQRLHVRVEDDFAAICQSLNSVRA